MLILDDVTVTFGRSQIALDRLSMSLPIAGPETVTALLGPSGCGKSTLIRAIAGLQPIDSGRILFEGNDLAPVPVHRRDFGVVFQSDQLFTGRSVAANVAYGLRVRRWSKSAIAERVREVLALVDLAGRDEQPVQSLSGGQAQRVALARALAPHPRLLLLDEPLSALDQRLRRELADDLAEIISRTMTPTLFVTHDQDEAALLADRIAVMNAGRIVQMCSPATLWRRPADEWVARFLGFTAIVDAAIEHGIAHTELGDVALTLFEELGDPTARSVQIALRTESIRCRAADGHERSSATALSVAALPGRWRVHMRIDLPGQLHGLRVHGISEGVVHPGDRLIVSLDPTQIAVVG